MSDDIINNTVSRNTVLITGRPDINIYPHYPVTEDIKNNGGRHIFPLLLTIANVRAQIKKSILLVLGFDRCRSP